MQCCYVLYNTSFLIMIMSRIQRKRTFITKTVGTNINRFDLKNTRGGQGPGASRPVFIFRCSFAKFTLCKWQNCQANHFYLTASFISDYLHWSPSLSFFAILFHCLHFLLSHFIFCIFAIPFYFIVCWRGTVKTTGEINIIFQEKFEK